MAIRGQLPSDLKSEVLEQVGSLAFVADIYKLLSDCPPLPLSLLRAHRDTPRGDDFKRCGSSACHLTFSLLLQDSLNTLSSLPPPPSPLGVLCTPNMPFPQAKEVIAPLWSSNSHTCHAGQGTSLAVRQASPPPLSLRLMLCAHHLKGVLGIPSLQPRLVCARMARTLTVHTGPTPRWSISRGL